MNNVEIVLVHCVYFFLERCCLLIDRHWVGKSDGRTEPATFLYRTSTAKLILCVLTDYSFLKHHFLLVKVEISFFLNEGISLILIWV